MTDILNERQKTHGDFTDNADISQELKQVMYLGTGWLELTATQREALDMICLKIGRILSGDPNFKDHWDDISGYAALAARACDD